ncbi:uncharacterized protein [Spinacia oleracea]|uniref:Reverse transcriptase domain-containing protein n=1 Tax=Spinacia oleracea TaxID=3562 RepID=A0ABM3QX45_SPIOL|nr:uncharacterized protein LOC110789683 [Spinacia oleracea]
MHKNPTNQDFADTELRAIQEYKVTNKIYLEFLSQKAKIAWLRDGDENSALFHQSIRSRNLKNQIYNIHDMGGVWKDNPTQVADAFLDYYKQLLGSKHESRTPVLKQVVQLGPVCQAHHKAILNANHTAEEVRDALFSIPGAKAPGPDGFGSHFFKDSWHIVGDEVVAAVLDMLQQGKILKELNHTVITLIPKTKCPKDVSEFRPISCCNTLLRQVLPDLILENQGGFVHGRFIVHNIMVVQDLVRQYGRKGVKPSCLMKIDLQKAHDTVDWQFLQEMLEYLEFPQHFVDLVMQCVSTPMFSLMFNGSMHGFFKSKRGLRVITHLSYYYQQKSSIYCHGMSERDVQRVVDVSGFTRSFLPFKYLGVPICSKKILVAQCSHLVDKIIARIKAQIYVLPKSVLQDIVKICRAFLWSGQAYSQKPSNIAWENTCCGKQFGGLGFRDIILWNTAAMGKYVWALVTKKDNVWIKWVSSVYLKDGDWWDYKPPVSASWYWKQICKTKEQLKQFFTKTDLGAMTTYSVKQVYEKIAGTKRRVHWDKVVWNRLTNPKHRFIGWLAMQSRLQTTSKLARIGVSQTAHCLICSQGDETHQHLFFQCVYSSECLRTVKTWLGVSATSNSLTNLVSQVGHSRCSKFKKQVCYAAIVAAVYLIWHCRNTSYCESCVPTVTHTVSKLKQVVRGRIQIVMPKSISRRDSEWFMKL